jgi:hypothetical protein
LKLLTQLLAQELLTQLIAQEFQLSKINRRQNIRLKENLQINQRQLSKERV